MPVSHTDVKICLSGRQVSFEGAASFNFREELEIDSLIAVRGSDKFKALRDSCASNWFKIGTDLSSSIAAIPVRFRPNLTLSRSMCPAANRDNPGSSAIMDFGGW